MSIFVKATLAPTPKNVRAQYISLLYAAVLIIFALTQLYTFDTFIELIPAFRLPFGDTLVYLIAPLIVVAEVFALPFLLRMRVSPAFRFLSIGFAWLVALLWLFISIWLMTTPSSVETIGFFGTLVDLIPGWWAVLFSGALVILAAWSSWGMWPVLSRKKHTVPSKK